MDPTIPTKEHFKLIINFEDFIRFENELVKHSIPFWKYDYDPIQYFFLTEDAEKIDEIIVTLEITSGTEHISPGPSARERKGILFFYGVFGIVLLLTLLLKSC